MEIKGADKIKNMADNTLRMTSAMVILNKQGLEEEQGVLKQIDKMIDKLTPKFADAERLYEIHPDEENIVKNYKELENKMKEAMVVRELSEEAIKQFELNLDNLGV